MPGPQPSAEQSAIITARARRLQVIACAGSGKTEAMAQRVAALLAEGVPPAAIVAFTFTERAAASLKQRVFERAEDRLGTERTARLGPLFVGTIHAYCFRLLQEHAPEYGSFDLLDEHRLAALVSREHGRLGLERLGSRHWRGIGDFLRNVQAVENELIPTEKLEGEFGACYGGLCDALKRYRLLTYGQLITLAIKVLEGREARARLQAVLQHLVVDEYQDINPAQERLIELMTSGGAGLCVVGDDDQGIYQWRGSDLANLQRFTQRHPEAKRLPLSENRRSRPSIIAAANRLALGIKPRLEKTMLATRGDTGSVLCSWAVETPEAESEMIATAIARLHERGCPYRAIAVLYRSVRTSAPPLLAELDRRGIPFQCAGRTGLFLQPEAMLLGRTLAWLCGNEWKDARFGESAKAELPELMQGFAARFGGPKMARVRAKLEAWRASANNESEPANLVGEYYGLLHALGVQSWNLGEPETAARMGTLARFSSLLADFEHAKRRARWVESSGGLVHRGGHSGGLWFYRQLFSYVQFYALGAYEDFAGEANPGLDAVDVLTVHQAKGLEWPVVFVPGLSARRFPSSKAGRKQNWMLPEAAFPASSRGRYEGGEMDERRLFYVALTRARDVLYVSRFRKTAKQTATPSPFLRELDLPEQTEPELPREAGTEHVAAAAPLRISFSDLAGYEACPFSYRLRALIGFEPQLAQELGYGRAVHSVLRRLAVTARTCGRLPTEQEANAVLEGEFYLPFANRPAFEQLKAAAWRLVRDYLGQHGDDLLRIWDTERPFELRVEGATVQGRADVIYDHEDGRPLGLALADYKTAADAPGTDVHAFQLALYAAAARQEGLDVRAAYLHDLGSAARIRVDVGGERASAAAVRAAALAAGVTGRRFPPQPAAERCARCDVNAVCGSATAR